MKRTDTTETYDPFDTAMIAIMHRLYGSSNGPVEQEPWWSKIVALREIVAAGEREACAVIIEGMAELVAISGDGLAYNEYGYIAAKIRARGGE